MAEVLVQLWLVHLAMVVHARKLIHTAPVLFGVGPQQVRKVRRLRLRRHTQTLGMVPREARRWIPSRLTHPHRAILFDRRTQRTLQPRLVVPRRFVCHQARVHTPRKVGQERRLRAQQVVRAVAIHDLVVMLNLKDKVVHGAFGQVQTPVFEQTQRNKIAVPVVQLVEARARHHERDALHVYRARELVHLLLHRNGQQARPLVQVTNILGRKVRGQRFDVQLEIRALLRHAAIVRQHIRLVLRDIQKLTTMRRPVLGIEQHFFQTLGINPTRQIIPKHGVNHARQSMNGIFGQLRLANHHVPLTAVFGES